MEGSRTEDKDRAGTYDNIGGGSLRLLRVLIRLSTSRNLLEGRHRSFEHSGDVALRVGHGSSEDSLASFSLYTFRKRGKEKEGARDSKGGGRCECWTLVDRRLKREREQRERAKRDETYEKVRLLDLAFRRVDVWKIDCKA